MTSPRPAVAVRDAAGLNLEQCLLARITSARQLKYGDC